MVRRHWGILQSFPFLKDEKKNFSIRCQRENWKPQSWKAQCDASWLHLPTITANGFCHRSHWKVYFFWGCLKVYFFFIIFFESRLHNSVLLSVIIRNSHVQPLDILSQSFSLFWENDTARNLLQRWHNENRTKSWWKKSRKTIWNFHRMKFDSHSANPAV